MTASGIHTRDGAHHESDAIIYGTGFEVRTGLRHDTLVGTGGMTIQQAWHDGMEPYLGVALRGFPELLHARRAGIRSGGGLRCRMPATHERTHPHRSAPQHRAGVQ